MKEWKTVIFLVLIASTLCMASPKLSASSTLARATSAPESLLSFAVASIKHNPGKDGRWKLEFTSDGFSARGVTLRQLIEEAWTIYDDDRILGEKREIDNDRFDIEAKVDEADTATFQNLDREQRKTLLKKLLVERFDLKLHEEKRERPIYKLVIDKDRPWFKLSSPDRTSEKTIDPPAHISQIRRGHLEMEQFSMVEFTRLLSHFLDRQVIDSTSLDGRYDLKLDWDPDDGRTMSGRPGGDINVPKDPEPAKPSIFTALREQLGLKLVSTKAAVEVLVVDHATAPIAN